MASNFDKLANKLARQPGVQDPRAMAAMMGRKKFGAAAMAKGAAAGQPAANFARKSK